MISAWHTLVWTAIRCLPYLTLKRKVLRAAHRIELQLPGRVHIFCFVERRRANVSAEDALARFAPKTKRQRIQSFLAKRCVLFSLLFSHRLLP